MRLLDAADLLTIFKPTKLSQYNIFISNHALDSGLQSSLLGPNSIPATRCFTFFTIQFETNCSNSELLTDVRPCKHDGCNQS